MSPGQVERVGRDSAEQGHLPSWPSPRPRSHNTDYPLSWDSLEDRMVLSKVSAAPHSQASPIAALLSPIAGERGRAENPPTNPGGAFQGAGNSHVSSQNGPSASDPGPLPNPQITDNSIPRIDGSGGYPIVPKTGPTLQGNVVAQHQFIPALLPLREPALSVVPGGTSLSSLGVPQGLPSTLIANGQAIVIGGDVLSRGPLITEAVPGPLSPIEMPSQVAIPGQASVIVSNAPVPASFNELEMGAGSLAFLSGPSDTFTSVRTWVISGAARNPAPGLRSEDGRSGRGELIALQEVPFASPRSWEDSRPLPSLSTRIKPAESHGAHWDQAAALPAMSDLLGTGDSPDDLTVQELTEATRRFAALSVFVGVLLAWKSHELTRKAKGPGLAAAH
jgi:hypothetical protein